MGAMAHDSGILDPHSSMDYMEARKRAFRDGVYALFSGRKNTVLSFEQIRKALRGKPSSYRGVRSVPVKNIVGSESRFNDFSLHFAPKKKFSRSRWMRIATAFRRQDNLPPVVLYEVGGVYFVRDGNHRVSAAKHLRIDFIDAEIVSLDADIHFSPDMTRDEMRNAILRREKAEFMKATALVPDIGADLDFSEIAQFDRLLLDIENFRGDHSFGDLKAAARGWHDALYLPFLRLHGELEMDKAFPGRTPADLYIWMTWYKDRREHYEKGCRETRDAAELYRDKFGRTPGFFLRLCNRFISRFRK